MTATSWLPILPVIATIVAAGISVWGARRASRDQHDVQSRTVSLDEMQAALEWTGKQLIDLRTLAADQQVRIRVLEEQHLECERDKRNLMREVATLKGHTF